MNVPIITIHIERMTNTLRLMLSEHAALLDSQIQAAIDKELKPENLQHFIDQQVSQTIRSVVSDEIRRAFDYSSAGRAAIREAILDYVDRNYAPTPMESKGTERT